MNSFATSNGGFHEHSGRSFVNTPQWDVHDSALSWAGGGGVGEAPQVKEGYLHTGLVMTSVSCARGS